MSKHYGTRNAYQWYINNAKWHKIYSSPLCAHFGFALCCPLFLENVHSVLMHLRRWTYQIDSEIIEVLNVEFVQLQWGQFQIKNQDNEEFIVLKLLDCNLLIHTSLQLIRLFLSMEVIKACKVHSWFFAEKPRCKTIEKSQLGEQAGFLALLI